MVKRLPAEWAQSCPGGPLLDAAEAEAMQAQGQAGWVVDVTQTDGATVGF